MTRFCTLKRFLRQDVGTATVEFVIAVPVILAFLFSSIDYGVTMLRQVFLDRAVDIAVRQVRLGVVRNSGLEDFRSSICENTFMLGNCEANMSIQLVPVDTSTWAGLGDAVQCVDRSADIAPVLEFNPAAGRQELMKINVCVAADPFLRLTGIVLGMEEDASGSYYVVSRAAFANEPS